MDLEGAGFDREKNPNFFFLRKCMLWRILQKTNYRRSMFSYVRNGAISWININESCIVDLSTEAKDLAFIVTLVTRLKTLTLYIIHVAIECQHVCHEHTISYIKSAKVGELEN